ELRVYWEVSALGRTAGAVPQPLLNSPSFVSSLGTLAPAGIVWGHLLEPHQLFPDPAPLWQLDSELRSVGVDSLVKEEPGGWRIRLTAPGEDVDMRPSAGGDGVLVFIRAT